MCKKDLIGGGMIMKFQTKLDFIICYPNVIVYLPITNPIFPIIRGYFLPKKYKVSIH